MASTKQLNDFQIVKIPQNVIDNLGNQGADKLHVITKNDTDTNLEVYSAQRTKELIESAKESFSTGATGSSAGLMSAADKAKLDKIEAEANKYVLPNAGTTLGGVKTGGDVTITDGVITVNDDSHNHVISNVDGLQDALNLKAPLASPALTGKPTAPTAAEGANDTQIATTAFVHAEISDLVSGPVSSTDAHVAVFDGTTGKVVKDSGFTIGKSVPANAKFTDTTYNNASTTAAGLMSADDKAKLNTVAENANNYSHPAPYTAAASGLYKVTVNTEGHVTATTKVVKADITGLGIPAQDTTYNNASTTTAGLMSAADKAKLDKIEAEANKYVLPNAGTALGGVKTGGDVTITDGVITVNDDSHNHVINNVDGLQDALNLKAPLASPALTGTPTAPTAAASTNNTQIATTAFVQTAINSVLGASAAMTFKGSIGSNADITSLPATHDIGDTYVVKTAGSYAGQKCEVGDMIICNTSGTTANNAHWSVIQTNIDGAVTGPANSVADHVAVFDGTTGKVVKDSGFTIASSVPANAKFTDTVYTHPSHTAAASGLYKVTVNELGHVTATSKVVKSDITGLGIPAQDTTYNNATTTAAGLMSASDKAKLDAVGTTITTYTSADIS